MRIFLVWADNAPEMQVLINAITNGGHEILYWVGERGGEKYAPSGTIFHDHYEAWAGKPAEAFANEHFSPPSRDFLEKHYELESLALTMMNKRYERISIDERKQMYYGFVAYWHEMFERLKPEAIVFTTIPHSIYDLVLYSLAREKGLITLMFEDTWIAGRLIWINDYQNGSSAFAAALARNRSKSFTWEEIGEELREYHHIQTGHSPSKPAYVIAQQHKNKAWELLKHRARIAHGALFDGRLPRLLWNYLRQAATENLASEYARYVKAPDWTVPFVYFPLGFQPERTTAPQGEVFHDQILAAQTLSAALPKGWEIYIKEHPSQWWMRSKTRFSGTRYRGYYKRLAEIGGVRLVPIDTDSHTLIDRSKSVATITGTAGWEALFRLKRPLIFGYPWYLSAPQLFRVGSVEDCKHAFAEIEKRPLSRESDLLYLLKSFEEGSMRAYIGVVRDLFGVLPKDVSVSAAESMRMVAERINRELRVT